MKVFTVLIIIAAFTSLPVWADELTITTHQKQIDPTALMPQGATQNMLTISLGSVPPAFLTVDYKGAVNLGDGRTLDDLSRDECLSTFRRSLTAITGRDSR
jgi:hypothetical protein